MFVMQQTVDRLRTLKVVPVVRLDRVEDAVPLAQALLDGGLPLAEITFRTEAAEASIVAVRAAFPELMVGAGTVINLEQAERAFAAGCSFVVSPGISRPVIEYCLDRGVPVFPGACTPSELITIAEYGLPVAKFFPAQNFGGLAAIKSLASVFGSIEFMPTGGIGPRNITEYLAFDRIVACGGSWMVAPELIAAGAFDQIRSLVQEVVATVND